MALKISFSREEYARLCEVEPSIPLFSQAWWLDAVAGEKQWGAVLAHQGKEVVGALPYVKRRRFGFTTITQPTLTQCLGPWVKPSERSYPRTLAFEKDVLGALADNLPAYHHYTQNWHCSQQNWLPFYWRGFEQTTKYTYRIAGIHDQKKIWEGLQQNIRGDIRKAQHRFNISVRLSEDIDEFLKMNRKTFERQNISDPCSESEVRRIDAACVRRDAREIWIATDRDDIPHAAVYIVRSGDTAYYLMGGGDPRLRSSGATSLCLWEAIRHQPREIEYFDFEGSMLESIERFFRGFGARQTSYFRISRTTSQVLSLLLCLRNIRKVGS